MRWLAAGVYLVAAVFGLKWMWLFWTPRCNESCPGGLMLAIYLSLLCGLIGSVFIAGLTAVGKLGLRRSLVGFTALATLLGAVAAVLTQVFHP